MNEIAGTDGGRGEERRREEWSGVEWQRRSAAACPPSRLLTESDCDCFGSTTLFLDFYLLYCNLSPSTSFSFSHSILLLSPSSLCVGHPGTYCTRQAALHGYGSISLMHVTVFTLSQFGVKHSWVFWELAIRSMKRSKVSHHEKDLDVPQETDNTDAGKITWKLMGLLSEEKKIIVSGNEQAEKLLSELANVFSSTISAKNLTVTRRISSLE